MVEGVASSHAVRASAPGKVIITGEHSILYGKSALACAIDLRTQVTLQKILQEETRPYYVMIQFPPNWGYNHHATIEFSKDELWETKTMAMESIWIRGILAILNKIQFRPTFSLKMEIVSSLPLASGLGSSAAFSVAVSGAFIYLQNGEVSLDWAREVALTAESLFHGRRMSGIDPEACLQGGYVTGQIGKFTSFTAPKNSNLKWGIIVTGIPKCTAKTTAAVSELKNSNGSKFTETINQIGAISDCIITQHQANDEVTPLWSLINENHQYLAILGASHPTMDDFYQFIKETKMMIGGKVTGAGGGGSMLLLLSDDNVSMTSIEEKIAEIWPDGRLIFPKLAQSGLKVEEINH